MKYINGKIYKIQVKDDFKNSSNMLSLEQLDYINSIYIGSTILSLYKRFKDHKLNHNRCSSKILFNLFGKNNLEIILIKEYLIQQEEKIHYCLLMYETLYINKCRLNKLKIINKINSFRINYIADKDYRLNNKDNKKESNKNYYENNKEYFNNYNKEYYKNNKTKYYCDLCDIYFVCESYLNKHKDRKSHKLKNKEEFDKDLYKYQCKYCNVYLNNKELFIKHIKSIEHINILKNNNIDNNDSIYKFKYECKQCNFQEDNKHDYNNHLLSKQHREIFNITDDYLFKCEPCKYYQNIKKLFNRHLKTKTHLDKISI